MARETHGLRYLDQLLLGTDELQWLQDEKDELQRRLRLALSYEIGWIGGPRAPNGQEGFGWRVRDQNSDGLLSIQNRSGGGNKFLAPWQRKDDTTPLMGVMPDGQLVVLQPQNNDPIVDSAGAQISVPDDGVWYTLVARAVVDVKAIGTIDVVGGSGTIVGDGTGFTRYADSSDPRATKIRIDVTDTVNGNEGTYSFATITDDENATISPAPPATETGLQFRVKGDFFSGSPADPDIQNNLVVQWELITRTVTPPSDALVAYDVMRDTGSQPEALLIDRRQMNVYRPMIVGYNRRWWVAPIGQYTYNAGGAPWNAMSTVTINVDSPGASRDSTYIAAAAASVGADLEVGTILGQDARTGMIACIVEQGGSDFNISCREYVPFMHSNDQQWRNPDGGGDVTVVTAQTGTCDGIDLIAVPANSGFTHLLFVVTNTGSVVMQTSDDNGATWAGGGTLWDPTSFNAGDGITAGVSAVLTRTGRIIVVGGYLRNAASDVELRYIYSDDLGATWSTNSNEGTELLDSGSLSFTHPDIVEDDLGNLWTAYMVDNTHVRVVRGSGVNDPADSAEGPTGGWRVDAEDDSATYTFERPHIVACPDGQLLVFYVERVANTVAHLRCSAISRGHIAMSHGIMGIAGSGATSAIGVYVTQDPGGYIHCLYQDLEVADSPVREQRFYAFPIEQMGWLWPGGL